MRKQQYVQEWGNKSVFKVEIHFQKRFQWYQSRKTIVAYAVTREELAHIVKEWHKALNWVRHLRDEYFENKSNKYVFIEILTSKYSFRYVAAQENITVTVHAGSKPKPRYFRVPNKGNFEDYVQRKYPY